MHTLRLLLLATLMPAGTAASQAATPAEQLALAERSVVDGIARDGFAAGVVAALTPRGIVLWPGAPVLAGADSSGRLLRAQRSLDSLRVSWQPLGLAVSQDGSFGATWGVAVAAPPNGAARIGRYIAAWQREQDTWRLAALVPIALFPAATTTLAPGLAELTVPALAPSGTVAGFVQADLDFARLAGDSGAAVAFERYAAPDAITLGGGLLNLGPAAIGRAVAGPARWSWHPVAAGGSAAGDLGFTVGESLIRPESGPVSYGKYLTIWRRQPDGSIRYVTDGGSARPARP